jgi:hypothetical protein
MELNDLDFTQATLTPESEAPEQEPVTSETETQEQPEASTQEPEAEAQTPQSTDTTTQETPAETAPQESEDEAFARLFKAKYGYESVDEYQSAKLAELQAQEPAYASEDVKKLNEWVSKGLKPEDYYKTQTQNFDEMSDVDVVKNLYALKRPKLTPAQIDLLLNKKFSLSEDDFDEDEVELGKIELMDEADKARQELKEWQVERATPPQDVQAQQAQAELQAWQETVDKFLPSIQAIDIPLDAKGDKFSFAIDDKQGLEGMMKNLNSFFADYVAVDAKGAQSYRLQELAQDMYIAKNWRKVAQSIAAQSKSKGVEQVKQEINNSSAPQKDSTTPTGKSTEEKLGEFLFGRR